jgi:hypothetical protein
MAFAITSAFGVTGSPSNFQSADGDMVATGTFNDWATVDGTCTASASGCSSGNYAHLADSSSSSDDSFTPGQKQDTVCPDTTGHGNPNKDDFTDIASYSETDSAAPHHTFLYGATIRVAANGSASENIELKQGLNGKCGTGDLLARSLGDRMIAIDYTGGGANVAFNVLTWIVDGNGFDPTPSTNPADDVAGACFVGSDVPPCWSVTVRSLDPSIADGSTNPAVIDTGNNSISGARLVVNKFAEFGVDLVAAGSSPKVHVSRSRRRSGSPGRPDPALSHRRRTSRSRTRQSRTAAASRSSSRRIHAGGMQASRSRRTSRWEPLSMTLPATAAMSPLRLVPQGSRTRSA